MSNTHPIQLSNNENPIGPSPKVVAALYEAIPNLGRYPVGQAQRLKERLAARFSVLPQQVLLANGSDTLLEWMMRAFLVPDLKRLSLQEKLEIPEVILSEYAFYVYAAYGHALGVTVVEVPALNWGHDLNAMYAAITERTRMMIIANPNNPTGTWTTAAELRVFMQGVPKDIWVIIDQAYLEYIDDPDYPNAIEWLSKYPNLMVTGTFSKAYGLAGLRVGYGIVADHAIADRIGRLSRPFSVNAFGLTAALAALEDEEHIERTRRVTQAGKAQLYQACSKLGLPYTPSAGNFVMVEFGAPAHKIWQALGAQGIKVRLLQNYGLPRHVRVSVGTAQDNARFIEGLEHVLKSPL